jgi:hypothetical protein
MNGFITSDTCNITPSLGMDICAAFEKQPKGLIFTNPDFKVPAGTADIGDYIRKYALPYQFSVDGTEDGARLLNGIDVPPVVFPLLEGLTNLEPTGGDVRISQEGFGSGVVNGHENYQEMYTFLKGGLCMYKQLAKMEGRDYRVFFVDEDNKAYGVRQDDGTTRGFMANIGVNYRKNVGTTPAALMVTLLYSTSYVKDFKNLTSFEVSEDLASPKELMIEVLSMSYVEATSMLTLNLRIVTACSGNNLNAQFLEALSRPEDNDLLTLLLDTELDGNWIGRTVETTVLLSDGTLNVLYNVPSVAEKGRIRFIPTNPFGSLGLGWVMTNNLRYAVPFSIVDVDWEAIEV